MSICQQLDVFDVPDTAAGLRIHDIGPLLDPPVGSACGEHVHAHLSSLRSRVGLNIVHSECQAMPRLGSALLLSLADERRVRQLRLLYRNELVTALRSI